MKPRVWVTGGYFLCVWQASQRFTRPGQQKGFFKGGNPLGSFSDPEVKGHNPVERVGNPKLKLKLPVPEV